MVAGTLVAFLISCYFLGDIAVWNDWIDLVTNIYKYDMSEASAAVNPGLVLNAEDSFELGSKGRIVLATLICTMALGLFWWGRKSDAAPGRGRLCDKSQGSSRVCSIAGPGVPGSFVAFVAGVASLLHVGHSHVDCQFQTLVASRTS